MRPIFALLVASLVPSAAFAGRCDTLAKRAASAKGDAAVTAWRNIATCDAALGQAEFPRSMKNAGSVESLVPLSLAAIELDLFQPVWEMMHKLPSEHRADVATGIGAACEATPKVRVFLQGSFAGLRGPDFLRWQPAYDACGDAELVTWVEGEVATPPASPYNDKYNALANILIHHKGHEALPTLEQAAIKAGAGEGPFSMLSELIQSIAKPQGYAAKADPKVVDAVEQTLLRVAKAVPAEQARLVADRLYTAGNEAAAASLLPAIYPDRVQPDGGMLWAVAGIESCDDKAMVHWAAVSLKPERMSADEVLAPTLQATKRKLKCGGDLQIIGSTEPLADASAAKGWAAQIVDRLASEGTDAKMKEAKVKR